MIELFGNQTWSNDMARSVRSCIRTKSNQKKNCERIRLRSNPIELNRTRSEISIIRSNVLIEIKPRRQKYIEMGKSWPNVTPSNETETQSSAESRKLFLFLCSSITFCETTKFWITRVVHAAGAFLWEQACSLPSIPANLPPTRRRLVRKLQSPVTKYFDKMW